MFVSYKEMIICSVVILLDGIIVYYIPGYFNSINLFYPMLTISLIPFLYSNNSKKYHQLCFILGIIYDLLYSNIFLYHGLMFLLLSKINFKVMKQFNNNLFLYILLAIINIIFYDTCFYLLITLTNYQIVDLASLLYKIKNSLLLNIMSVFIYYFWFKKTFLSHKI